MKHKTGCAVQFNPNIRSTKRITFFVLILHLEELILKTLVVMCISIYIYIYKFLYVFWLYDKKDLEPGLWGCQSKKEHRQRRMFSIKSLRSWHPRTPKVGRDRQAEEIRELCQALWAVKEIYGICVCSNQAWVCWRHERAFSQHLVTAGVMWRMVGL